MKRILSIFLTVALLTGTLIFATSCSPQYEDDGKLTVVTTVFPLYDWSRELLKGNEEAELLFLQDSGADLHSYSPNADDLLQIMTCDVFIYVGGASDAWVESALQNAVNPNRKVLNLLSLLGELAREEETVEGMESEAEEEGKGEPICTT